MEFLEHETYGPTNYAEYLETPEGEIWEIIEGEPVLMAPSPNKTHQRIVTNLAGEFHPFLKGTNCEHFVAPLDVRLFAESTNNQEIKTVVQPDFLIVCDPTKLDQRGCFGAPDLVVEVLSPSNVDHDRGRKLGLYRKAGVRECWLIDPVNESIEAYHFEQDPERIFATAIYDNKSDKEIKVGIFDHVSIQLADLFS